MTRALFIAAPASGQGKTTITAALARHYRRQGLRVRVFKTGPDFLDPMILDRASGAPVYQLDLWMGGEEHCRSLLRRAAAESDLILVEGVMGLFDGEPSGADLAVLFQLPVLGVIDASAMAQTFGAIAYGLANYRSDVRFAGVVANRVASVSHAELVRGSLPPGMRWFGSVSRDAGLELPSRHLGLHQAAEIADLDARIDAAADAIATGVQWADLPAPADWGQTNCGQTDEGQGGDASAVIADLGRPLQDCRIAIAFDDAFSFLYHANLDLLRELGAEFSFFSPLRDAALPEADALYFPGGYPELHLQALADNRNLHAAIRQHHAKNKPILAECGGMMYLLEQLENRDGEIANMVGLLPGRAVMQPRLVNLGMHEVNLPEGTLRGHTFHHSMMYTSCTPLTHTVGRRGKPEAVFRVGRLQASYLHCYFPSNPLACAKLFAS